MMMTRKLKRKKLLDLNQCYHIHQCLFYRQLIRKLYNITLLFLKQDFNSFTVLLRCNLNSTDLS